ncbi:MAG: Rrf2 family transcriptional regulator [Pontiella sp.]
MTTSSRAYNATRILLCIFRFQGNNLVSKALISKQEKLSAAYIGQILVQLRGAGLVYGVRGVNGGYRIMKDSSEITLLDILQITEGNTDVIGDVPRGCRCSEPCLKCLWDGAGKTLRDYFCGITLKQLHDEYAEKHLPLNYII